MKTDINDYHSIAVAEPVVLMSGWLRGVATGDVAWYAAEYNGEGAEQGERRLIAFGAEVDKTFHKPVIAWCEGPSSRVVTVYQKQSAIFRDDDETEVFTNMDRVPAAMAEVSDEEISMRMRRIQEKEERRALAAVRAQEAAVARQEAERRKADEQAERARQVEAERVARVLRAVQGDEEALTQELREEEDDS